MGVKHYDDMVEALRLDYFNDIGVRSAFPEVYYGREKVNGRGEPQKLH